MSALARTRPGQQGSSSASIEQKSLVPSRACTLSADAVESSCPRPRACTGFQQDLKPLTDQKGQTCVAVGLYISFSGPQSKNRMALPLADPVVTSDRAQLGNDPSMKHSLVKDSPSHTHLSAQELEALRASQISSSLPEQDATSPVRRRGFSQAVLERATQPPPASRIACRLLGSSLRNKAAMAELLRPPNHQPLRPLCHNDFPRCQVGSKAGLVPFSSRPREHSSVDSRAMLWIAWWQAESHGKPTSRQHRVARVCLCHNCSGTAGRAAQCYTSCHVRSLPGGIHQVGNDQQPTAKTHFPKSTSRHARCNSYCRCCSTTSCISGRPDYEPVTLNPGPPGQAESQCVGGGRPRR